MLHPVRSRACSSGQYHAKYDITAVTPVYTAQVGDTFELNKCKSALCRFMKNSAILKCPPSITDEKCSFSRGRNDVTGILASSFHDLRQSNRHTCHFAHNTACRSIPLKRNMTCQFHNAT